VIAGYYSADLFIAALKKTGKNLTAARFAKVANTKLSWSVPGVVGATSWPASHDRPTPCGSLVQSNGTSFQVVQAFICAKVVAMKPPTS
jgi:hypothetical protein